jgi:hypothetical protein
MFISFGILSGIVLVPVFMKRSLFILAESQVAFVLFEKWREVRCILENMGIFFLPNKNRKLFTQKKF